MKKTLLGLGEMFANPLFRIVLCIGGFALFVKTFPSPATNEMGFMIAIIISVIASRITQTVLKRRNNA